MLTNLRNATIIDQGAINAYSPIVVGVGAIGSHLAPMLASMGVESLTLVDFDSVSEENLGTQGFGSSDLGKQKVDAVGERIDRDWQTCKVGGIESRFDPKYVERGDVIFSCVDCMKTRRQLFSTFLKNHSTYAFLDARMSAESLEVYCVTDRSEASVQFYLGSLFPDHEAYQEGCTAKATVYCASIAAGLLCSAYKQFAMGQQPARQVKLDIFGLILQTEF